MERKAKVPKLRFPGFTDAWEQHKLGDIIDGLYNGQTPSRFRDDFWNGDINWLSSGELNRSVVKMTSEKITAAGQDNANLRIVPKNTFVMAITGLEAVGTRGNCGILGINTTLNQSCMAVFVNKKTLSTQFLFQWYKMIGEDYGIRFTQGTKQQSYNATIIKDLDICLPKVEEQSKIGIFLSNIDNLINLHQRKLSHLQAKKKSLLQKMFPKKGECFPELRFPGFTDAWEQRKLGDISYKVTTKNNNLEYMETFTNSAEYGVISQRDFFDKDISNDANLGGYYVVQNDDFVYNPRISTSAPVGPIKRNKLGRTGVMSPLYYVFKTHDIDNTFLETYFSTIGWHGFMKLNGDSGARADRFAIKDIVFREMPVPYPRPTEQQKIGDFFTHLDNLINLHQRKLTHLQTQKKALLQQMFV
ncbi:restriction endonuclease subunit S [Pectinatus frisingensis]|uniref:restriction endonuclease subunit S n=1 Tax=Pectinatus frisingensis TaxID=865 RepID=UPI0018C52C1B|nr:restriction endonuclease subunit S [Pectinatus frisingensis]